MSRARPIAQSGTFAPGDPGFRFRLVSQPADAELRGTIVFVHGFAEELNKSRRMVSRMARLLAADGWRVVQRDLAGCGDSSGDFVDASWAAWMIDVDAELSTAEPEYPVWLWGMRAGALLAGAVLARHPHANVLLWQPVLSGARHLQQFLRLKAGARIVGAAKVDGKLTATQRLRAGASVEVGGYHLGSALATGLEQATFDVPAGFDGRVVVFEMSTGDTADVSLALRHLAGQLRARGVSIEARAVRGPAFWQTQEIEECEGLLEQTLAAMSEKATDYTLTDGGIDASRERVAGEHRV